jgi:hypothetical protein
MKLTEENRKEKKENAIFHPTVIESKSEANGRYLLPSCHRHKYNIRRCRGAYHDRDGAATLILCVPFCSLPLLFYSPLIHWVPTPDPCLPYVTCDDMGRCAAMCDYLCVRRDVAGPSASLCYVRLHTVHGPATRRLHILTCVYASVGHVDTSWPKSWVDLRPSYVALALPVSGSEPNCGLGSRFDIF